jgi:hypothetical protein
MPVYQAGGPAELDATELIVYGQHDHIEVRVRQGDRNEAYDLVLYGCRNTIYDNS